MNMFRAIWRYIRAIGYLFTGRIDEMRKVLMLNPNVMQANYDEIIRDKSSRLGTFKKATGGLIAQQEGKVDKLKLLTAEVQKCEQLKAGAAGKAKAVVAKHGGNAEAVKTDPEYMKCQAAYRDFSSTLEEKQKMITELEADAARLNVSIQTHKNSIQGLLREIDALKSEKHEAVAEVISAKEEREIADMLSGISEDRSSKELQELRDVRRGARADARISREVAGVTARQAEDEFLNYAQVSVVDNEFDKMIGLPAPTQTPMIEMQPESVTIKPATEKVKEML
jgi:chromosome segregation ATPase